MSVWGTYAPSVLNSFLLTIMRNALLRSGFIRKRVISVLCRERPEIDVIVNGMRMRLFPKNNASERRLLLNPKGWDRRERSTLGEAITGQSGAVVVDIGANAGLYTLYLAQHVGPRSRILAVEPRADLLERLAFNEQLARTDKLINEDVSIEYCECAISDADGWATLSDGIDEGSRKIVSDGGGTAIATRRLDGLLAECGISAVDVLKIDVEGHEDRALLPYLTTVPDALLPRMLCIEVAHDGLWKNDVMEVLAARGYEKMLTTRGNAILQRVALNAGAGVGLSPPQISEV